MKKCTGMVTNFPNWALPFQLSLRHFHGPHLYPLFPEGPLFRLLQDVSCYRHHNFGTCQISESMGCAGSCQKASKVSPRSIVRCHEALALPRIIRNASCQKVFLIINSQHESSCYTGFKTGDIILASHVPNSSDHFYDWSYCQQHQ